MKHFGLFGFFAPFVRMLKSMFFFTVDDGSDVWVTLAGSLINGLTTKSLDLQTGEIDVTTQDSGVWSEGLPGNITGVLSFELKHDATDTYTYEELHAAMVAHAAVTYVYGKGVKTTGGQLHYGSAFITGLSKTDGMREASVVSVTMKLTGTQTLATSTTTVA